MQRLTKRDKNGNAFYAEYGEYLGVHKLADYEDTGLEPKEIEEMKQTLSEHEGLPKINVPAGSIAGWTIEKSNGD